MRKIIGLLLCAGCGGIEGEPIEGDIAIQYGDSSPDLVVGTAVQDENDPALMLVQIGSNNVDCDTYLDRLFSFTNPEGTFVFFSVDQAPGAYDDGFVAAMRSDNNNTKVNQAPGSITIDTVEPRVSGSVTFSTTDEEVGEITASGTFDVLRCF
jgi:hypothetical protein